MWGLGVLVRQAFGQTGILCAGRWGCGGLLRLERGFEGFQSLSPPKGIVGGALATQVSGHGRVVSAGLLGCGGPLGPERGFGGPHSMPPSFDLGYERGLRKAEIWTWEACVCRPWRL